MKKKLLCLFSILLVMVSVLLGSGNVNADTYTLGQLIDVKVNATETKQFYVLKDNGTTITAILKDFLGDPVPYFNSDFETGGSTCDSTTTTGYNDSNIKSVVDTRTAGWTNVTTVRLLSLSDLEDLIGSTLDNHPPVINHALGSSLTFLGGSKYWTETKATYQPAASECDVWHVLGSNTSQSSGCYEANVRPVITIDKTHIVIPLIPEPEPTPVENPSTGITSTYIFGGVILVSAIGAIVLFRKKNYFAKF